MYILHVEEVRRDAVIIMVVASVGYLVAYRLCGRFAGKKIFALSNANKTPAVQMEDGQDYVPTRKGIIFGHHFTSIAGTGPIVGPALGVVWGWLPALIWVLVGTIVMGAVHDFGALVMSLRNQGKSISEITEKYVNPRTRTIFFIIVFFELPQEWNLASGRDQRHRGSDRPVDRDRRSGRILGRRQSRAGQSRGVALSDQALLS
jgi:hypothetical protein